MTTSSGSLPWRKRTGQWARRWFSLETPAQESKTWRERTRNWLNRPPSIRRPWLLSERSVQLSSALLGVWELCKRTDSNAALLFVRVGKGWNILKSFNPRLGCVCFRSLSVRNWELSRWTMIWRNWLTSWRRLVSTRKGCFTMKAVTTGINPLNTCTVHNNDYTTMLILMKYCFQI